MTTELKEKYIKLLRKNDSILANAILFYLTTTNPELKKKKQFVEKVLDKYADIHSVSCGSYREWVVLKDVPQVIRVKLIESCREDLLADQKKQNNALKELTTEMNEIF